MPNLNSGTKPNVRVTLEAGDADGVYDLFAQFQRHLPRPDRITAVRIDEATACAQFEVIASL